MKNLKIVLLVSLTLLMLVSCGANEYESNTLRINKDLSIKAFYISDFPTDKYNIDELKDEVRESTELYNEDSPGAVKLNSCVIRDEKAAVEMEFASGEDYAAFNRLSFYAGPLEDALTGGTAAEDTEVSVYGEGTITTLGEIPDKEQLTLIMTEEPVNIEFKGNLSYINKYVKINEETGTISVDFGEDRDKTAVLVFSK